MIEVFMLSFSEWCGKNQEVIVENNNKITSIGFVSIPFSLWFNLIEARVNSDPIFEDLVEQAYQYIIESGGVVNSNKDKRYQFGRDGELVVRRGLKVNGYQVEEVSESQDMYNNRDILVEEPDGEIFTGQIKSSSEAGGLIHLEIFVRHDENKSIQEHLDFIQNDEVYGDSVEGKDIRGNVDYYLVLDHDQKNINVVPRKSFLDKIKTMLDAVQSSHLNGKLNYKLELDDSLSKKEKDEIRKNNITRFPVGDGAVYTRREIKEPKTNKPDKDSPWQILRENKLMVHFPYEQYVTKTIKIPDWVNKVLPLTGENADLGYGPLTEKEKKQIEQYKSEGKPGQLKPESPAYKVEQDLLAGKPSEVDRNPQKSPQEDLKNWQNFIEKRKEKGINASVKIVGEKIVFTPIKERPAYQPAFNPAAILQGHQAQLKAKLGKKPTP